MEVDVEVKNAAESRQWFTSVERKIKENSYRLDSRRVPFQPQL